METVILEVTFLAHLEKSIFRYRHHLIFFFCNRVFPVSCLGAATRPLSPFFWGPVEAEHEGHFCVSSPGREDKLPLTRGRGEGSGHAAIAVHRAVTSPRRY